MRRLRNAERNIWLLAAIPTSMAMISANPLWAIPAVCVAAILYYIVYQAIPTGSGLAQMMPKWLLILEWCFLLVVVGKTAGLIAGCWPKGNGVLFALVLLTLAGAAAGHGTAEAGRVASVLGWIAVAIIAVMLVPLTLETQKTQPNQNDDSWIQGFSVLSSAMLPLCGLFLPVTKQKKETGLWSGILIGTIFILYGSSGGAGEVPLLHAIKGLELFGIFRRFEAVAACVLTIGLFLILTLFFCSAREVAEEIEETGWMRKIFYPAGVAVYCAAHHISGGLVQYAAPLFWGVFPVLTLLVVPPEAREKRLKKSKKRC